MLKSVMIVAAAMALAAPVASAKAVTVQQQQQTVPGVSNQNVPGNLRVAFTLSCFSFQVGGNAPSVQFTNNGPGVVPAGTVVHWVVGASNGNYTIPNPLQVHQIVVLNGVARSGLGACSISVK